MQRVRIGLTGLCTVFLLVLLAAAVFGLAPADSVREPRTDPATGNASVDDPKDPLAELGVTPGGSQSDEPSAQAPVSAARQASPPATKPIP